MKDFLLKLMTFLILLFAIDRSFLIFKTGEKNIFNEIAIKKMSQVAKTIHSDKDFNILIFGSSHGQFGISPEIIQQNTKQTCLNLAYGGAANLGLQVALLKKILKETDIKPKAIIFAVDVFALNTAPKYDDEFQNTLFQSSLNPEYIKSTLFQSYIKLYSRFLPDYIKQVKKGNCIPPYFNPEHSYDLSMFQKFGNYEISELGWVKGRAIPNEDFLRYSKFSFSPNPQAVKDLLEFVNICRENNIKVILVQVPEHEACLKYRNKYNDFDHWMETFSKE
jgi:hypothetical protein